MANPEPRDEYETIEEIGSIELVRTPSCFAVFFDIDEHGEGFATDRDMQTFDTEEEAREFIASICS